MNKLDKQFEQMMKGIRIDSPSPDFNLRVMSRIEAEAAVQRKPLLQNYQPVIGKRTWIILVAVFLLLVIYITVSSQDTVSANDTGIWSTISEKIGAFNNKEVSSILSTGMSLFTSIPQIAYLIILSSLTLWTLDSFLTRFKRRSSSIRIN